MKRENYKEYLRLKRESKYVVEYALMLAENWSFYDASHDMDFLENVVKYLGSGKDYEKFNSYMERI